MMMTSKAGCGEDVQTSSLTEELLISHPEPHIDKERLLPVLPPPPPPPLPCVHSSLPSPDPPLSQQAYLQAASLFQRLRVDKPVTHKLLHYAKKTDAPLPESRDKAVQRQAFQLAFSTLKYQDLLEDIIMDSCFHTSQHISTDLLPLAMVMLFDFQDRRFLTHGRSTPDREETCREVRDLESSLRRCKTKLAASLARFRVKRNLLTVSSVLPDTVRTQQQRARVLPLYAWVNALKTSVEEVCADLRRGGFREAHSMSEVGESSFCRDPLCPDTLIFSQRLRQSLQNSSLVATRALNMQDRSVCVAATVLRPLVFDSGDVLLAGSFSAATVAHMAVVSAARSGRVLVCGADHAASNVQELKELLTAMEVKNVRVLSEAFWSLDEWDAAVQRVKVVVVLPQCSASALNDPVPTIHAENGDLDLLQDLSRGSVSRSKMLKLTGHQARLLAHALSFPKVQTVVYCTRSLYPEENEQLVRRVLEKTHTHPKLLPFRVNGPIFPDDARAGDTPDSKFFRLEPSHFTNGCFVARLSRQADPTKVETVQDVLARAAAKGLLGGIVPEPSGPAKKGKSKKKRTASAGSGRSSPSSEGLPGREDEDGVEAGVGEEGDAEKHKAESRKRKIKGLKGRKRKIKQRAKANNPAGSKKKSTKAHHKRRPFKSKPRRIPRLTLALISSAKSPHHLFPVAAQTEAACVPPAPARPPPKQAPKAGGEARQGPEATARAARPARFSLPPISSLTSSSASLSRPSSSMTASSSSVPLPRLGKFAS